MLVFGFFLLFGYYFEVKFLNNFFIIMVIYNKYNEWKFINFVFVVVKWYYRKVYCIFYLDINILKLFYFYVMRVFDKK